MKESDQTRALGIVGSPRRNGNTEILVDEILAGAEEAGALTEKIILNELNILPCQACNACQKIGKCVQKDDMSKILEKMQRSHVWVLGTPVYWWGPTAQFKAFLDRWYGVDRTVFRGRRVVLAIPSGGSDWYARHTVGMLSDIIPYLGMVHVATVLAPGGAHGHTDLLAKARRAGREAIEK
ncbi:MAG: flavodoxin family protein [Methanomicrobia archaeon]|nr:flavodoxin family protein [Methanomicrobia archaeon]